MPAKPVCAQEITLEVKEVALKSAFSLLNQQYGFHFIYVATTLEGLPHISAQVRNADIVVVMEALLENLPLTYKITGKVVAITRKGAGEAGVGDGVVLATGEVYDAETRQVVPHGGIQLISDLPVGETMTSIDGTFQFHVPVGTDSIRFTAIGYHPYTEAFTGVGPYHIALRPMVVDIDEVVVTGIVERKKENYTSATATLTGAELRQIGNTNVINSIRTLDPSFIRVANNLQGSNPNALAQMELRGKSSLTGEVLRDQFTTDPNLPLFILDGFESSLEQITDLDINRIESVTLLKDAASAALYGARSANGVVVVETLKPMPGKLNVFYNSDFSVELADLGDYNMMTATEKLEFERLAGRYKPQEGNIAVDRLALDRTYNDRLRTVLGGVNHYWLDVPLQTGYTHNNTIYMQGGDTTWQYGVGGNYRNRKGVMKGSGRNTWGGHADVIYRTATWNIQSKTAISGSEAFDSPTNVFSAYVRQNPYYTPSDTAAYLGEISYTDDQGTYREPNHTYNALLNSLANSRSWYYLQNFAVSWQLTPEWQITARLQITGDRAKVDTFLAPRDTRYALLNDVKKGEYAHQLMTGLGYQGNLMAVWNKKVATNRELTVNFRTELMQTDVNYRGYDLNGFPLDATGAPSQSYDYREGLLSSRPSPPTIRRVNALVSANYVIDNRYFLDATTRIDGSTQFGSANRYAAFWSAGLGWNIHKERFMQGRWEGLDVLRLRANVGLTGNQQFGSFSSTVSYTPIVLSPDLAEGIIHESLGNPNLEWQKTLQTNIGLDMVLWKGRLSFTANWFEKYTSPLIATIDLPPSTGVQRYSVNVGDLRLGGAEAVVRFSPVYQPQRRWIWTIGATALSYTSRYKNLSGILKGANEALKESKSLSRYQNSHSPDDVWAIRSVGIDPTTGREMFLTADGRFTYNYDDGDVVVVGNQRPWAEGVVSSYLSYRGFRLGVYFRYALGAMRFNEALYQKVENITFEELNSNQDRRALYDRWQQLGNQAHFKGISLLEDTPISSRFIQKENVFSGESLSLGYVWDIGQRLSNPTGVQRLRITGYANEFLRLSNILAERGIEYPFSRMYALSIGLVF